MPLPDEVARLVAADLVHEAAGVFVEDTHDIPPQISLLFSWPVFLSGKTYDE